MEKNTKILIGAGALALAYYLYNSSKAAAAVTPITTTPIAPIATTPMVTTPVGQVIMDHAQPDSLFIQGIGDIQGVGEKIDYTAQIAAADAAAKAAQAEIDRLAQVQAAADKAAADKAAQAELDRLAMVKAQQDESARQQAIMEAQNKANYEAYLKSQADAAAKLEEQRTAAAKIIADQAAADAAAKAAADKAAADALSHFVYGPPACPDKYEWYNGSCMPSYMVQQMKVTAQANNGEGYIFHDYSNNTTTLVKTCPSGYLNVDINCVAASSMSPQELQTISMKNAGMIQTSDGQWYKDAATAAAAQAIIDASKIAPIYSDRQKNINAAICSVDTSGFIRQPNSSVGGMSLSNYIGQYKVTASELGIARASCPSSVYSSGRIAGGMTNDEALGYK
jgi:hypothetical protein